MTTIPNTPTETPVRDPDYAPFNPPSTPDYVPDHPPRPPYVPNPERLNPERLCPGQGDRVVRRIKEL